MPPNRILSSPNYDERQRAIDMIVLHYTGMADTAAALARLCDPAAKVSAHYLIDDRGNVHQLVPVEKRAWHAGVSSWHDVTDVNSCSIGIELANPGHDYGYRPFPERQITALEEVCRDLMGRHDISAARVLGHSDVAPLRKLDPGELFDWRHLAVAGLALWPDPIEPPDEFAPVGIASDRDDVALLQAQLAQVGYGIGIDGVYGPITEGVVAAFQRHFRPARVDGRADGETQAVLDALLRLLLDG